MRNRILCIVSNTNKDTNFLNLEYEYNGTVYTLEAPKTENNEFLEENEKVSCTIDFELTNEQLKRRLKEE